MREVEELRFALLGSPVAHSRSPAIHDAALRSLGLDGRYEARESDEQGLLDAIAELRAGSLHGANLTMPLKMIGAELADHLTPDASVAGSVNTLRAIERTLEGHSTDVTATRELLASDRFDMGSPVLVLGAGGAAAAAVVGARPREAYLSARSPDRARALAERLGEESRVVPWGAPVAGAIVVNATPLGSGGKGLPAGILEEGVGLMDLPYGSKETTSVEEARRRGLPFADGVEFLAAQAAAAFTWWTGRSAPREVMLAAARKA